MPALPSSATSSTTAAMVTKVAGNQGQITLKGVPRSFLAEPALPGCRHVARHAGGLSPRGLSGVTLMAMALPLTLAWEPVPALPFFAALVAGG